MEALLDAPPRDAPDLEALVLLGLHHEQQHQELLVTDIKYNLGKNPLRPSYHGAQLPRGAAAPASRWIDHPGGVVEIGHGGPGFAFDNESPRHRVLLAPFSLASRPVTNGEFSAFVDDGGYRRPDLWLSEAWDAVVAGGWAAPLYWERDRGDWHQYTLSGLRAVDPEAPVCHLSHYEADAFARWAGARLPTEAEWEAVASARPVAGHFLDSGILHPVVSAAEDGPAQLYGDVWEWTSSAYLGYPGYRPSPGAVGEYNGKFMSGQMVLRGGSCATPGGHVRATYRNFFPPAARWQFSGVRFARDVAP
jgi:ergothioneine biosynthesis protein EgtB